MDMNNAQGCVLILLDTAHLERIAESGRTLPAEGIYSKGDITLTHAWPEKEDTKEGADYAIDSWKEKSQFHVAQWLVTPHFLIFTFVYSLRNIAVLPTNPELY